MKSISEIKTELIKDDEAALKAFVEIYSSDERDGVKKLVASAEKSLLAIENEKKRMWEMFHYERLYPEKQYMQPK